jgi:hypothetical protein
MTITNKWYSYPRVTVIRIDVYPARENPTNITRTLHTPVHVHFLWAVPIRGKLSRVINRVGQSHCSREKWLSTQSTSRQMTDPWVRTQFLSWANQWSSEESQTSIDSRLLGLSGPYHRYVIDTFNTCLRGSTHWSLTDTDRGYHLEGANFSHTTLRPSQPMVPSFPLKGPTWSPV